MRNPKLSEHPASNTEKKPDQWVSGGDPMTGAQASYIATCRKKLTENFPMTSSTRPRPQN